ncbi:MAG TPA: hypothetical protein VIJ92_06055 [Ginsengibacter sp.]
MLSCKKIVLLTLIAISSAGCLEQKILFDFKKDANGTFFKDIPGLGDAPYIKFPVTKKATTAEVYVSSFREKFIENDDLLEFSELNDVSTTPPSVDYWMVNGYSQNLYIIKYDFSYSVKNKKGEMIEVPVTGAVFFSLKRNGQNKVTGITPCYFGTVDEDANMITFDTELTLAKADGNFYLKFHQKKKDTKGLLFMPANFASNPTTDNAFNIEKIVNLDANKIGGYKSLVFNINKILKDPNALQFHYVDTINLTQ